MASDHLIVQCLNNSDKQIAEQALKKNGPVSSSEAYVRGYGDEEDVQALQKQGLIVEKLPNHPEMSWLDPMRTEEPTENLLSAEIYLGEQSPIQEAASESSGIYLLQLKGPLRTEWRQKLNEHGVRLTRYIPDFAFKALFDANKKETVEALPFVYRIIDYSPAHTLRRLTMALKEESGEEVKAAPVGMAPTTEEALPKTAPLGEFDDEPFADRGAAMMAGAPMAAKAMAVGMDDEVQEQETLAQEEETPELRRYEVKCHLRDDIKVVAEAMRRDERINRDLQEGRGRIRFSCEANSPVLGELAKMPQVSVIAPYEEPELTNDVVRVAIGVETEGDLTAALPWTGDGVIVGVADSGVDTTHPDLKDQLIHPVIFREQPSKPDDPSGHGTHVCGTIAGSGAKSGQKILGVAPGARLVVQSLIDNRGKLSGLPIDLGDLFQEAYDRGVRIHNNSWGTKADGLYSIDSYEVDEFVYKHPDFLVIVSAGNDGVQNDSEDPIGRISYSSLRSPATAKNSLSVGACCSSRAEGPFEGKKWAQYSESYRLPKVSEEPVCGSLDYLAAISSRGPSDDERIKPDVVAPGTAILSTRSKMSKPHAPSTVDPEYYAYMTGTSMAAPVVAGAAAITREYFVKEHKHQPSAALLKAALISSAVWLPTDTANDERVGKPNYHQGFGRIDLRRTLPTPGDTSGLRLCFADVDRSAPEALNKSDEQRATWKRIISVEPGLPLLVTLTWTDRAGHGLQQDLDLVVIDPDGKRTVGNHELTRGPWAKTDHRNNAERVCIDSPVEGDYAIHVIAYNTPFENQGFSLVVTGKLNSDLLP
jgi:subtilisin family serine protease